MHPIQVMPKPSTTKIREFRRWRISPQIVIAGLLTLFLFIGRWTPMRLAEGSDDNSSSLTIAEPRFIILLLLVTLLMYMSKASFRTYSQQLPKFVSSLTRSTEAAIPVCSKRARPTFLAMLSFFAYMIFTGVWSSDTSAAIHKSYELALILVCVYILSVFQDSRSLREYFIQLIVSLTVVLSVLGLVGLAKSGDTSRLSVLGGGPIVFGRNMAMMLVCCLFYTFKYRRGVFWPTLAVLAIALVLASGSRGALISAGVGCMTYLVMRKPAWKNIFMLLAVFAVGAFILYISPLGERIQRTFETRIVFLLIENQYTSGRDDIADEAIRLWHQNILFGGGIGSFAFSSSIGDFEYPHNLFLEVATDGGIVGLVLLALIPISILSSLRARGLKLCPITTAMVALLFVASQFSGDLFDNRGVFLFGMLMISSSETMLE